MRLLSTLFILLTTTLAHAQQQEPSNLLANGDGKKTTQEVKLLLGKAEEVVVKLGDAG